MVMLLTVAGDWAERPGAPALTGTLALQQALVLPNELGLCVQVVRSLGAGSLVVAASRGVLHALHCRAKCTGSCSW